MPFVTLEEGFVFRATPGGRRALAAGPRTAVAPTGEVLCTFLTQSKLAVNDFSLVLCRSSDGGKTWSEQGPVWPHLQDRWSIFASISRDAAGRLFLFGSRTPIEKPGESFWSDETQGLKQNELIWAVSTDGGRSWTDPHPVKMPIPGSAEAPGAMQILRSGRWIAPYSPYNTFDPKVTVDRHQVVTVYSDDQGKTWKHSSMLRFDDPQSGGAEAWTVELSDGRLLGTGWQISFHGLEHPNAYALSKDGGTTWLPTRSTGILGQSTALAPFTDGRAFFIYNQRKHGEPGVWLAVVKPTEKDFGIETNQIVWRAETRTQKGTSGEHSEWMDFSFGEPSVTRLPDGTLLVTLWCVQPTGSGIRYVKLRYDS